MHALFQKTTLSLQFGLISARGRQLDGVAIGDDTTRKKPGQLKFIPGFVKDHRFFHEDPNREDRRTRVFGQKKSAGFDLVARPTRAVHGEDHAQTSFHHEPLGRDQSAQAPTRAGSAHSGEPEALQHLGQQFPVLALADHAGQADIGMGRDKRKNLVMPEDDDRPPSLDGRTFFASLDRYLSALVG